MAANHAFSACLTRLGFDAPTCELLVDQGIASIYDLTNLPFPEIDKMVQHLSRWKPKVVEDDDDDPVAGPTFPYLSVRKFKAPRAWAKAYAMIATSLFTGKGKLSVDQYVGRHHQRIMNCCSWRSQLQKPRR